MAAQNLSQTNPLFLDSLLGRITTGRNFAPKKKTKKILKIYIKMKWTS